jgi:HAD superfamily hydrolase (TIGR01509 family)
MRAPFGKTAAPIDPPAAILFDFDGVIVDSEPLHCQAFREVAAAENIELTEAEYYRDLIGFDDRGAWIALFKHHHRTLDPDTFDRILKRKSDLARELIQRGDYDALPGVDEFVRGLARTIPLGICTGALREEVESMLDGVELRECFPVIVAAEDVEVGKPDPRGYLLAAQRISEKIGRKLPPSQCLIIEDAPSVAIRAREAGFNVLGVTTTFPQDAWPSQIPTTRSLRAEDVSKVLPHLPLTV